MERLEVPQPSNDTRADVFLFQESYTLMFCKEIYNALLPFHIQAPAQHPWREGGNFSPVSKPC